MPYRLNHARRVPYVLSMEPGQFGLYRGSWGKVVFVNHAHVFLGEWRGQLVTVAPLEEITDVKTDTRLGQDRLQMFGRRLTDF